VWKSSNTLEADKRRELKKMKTKQKRMKTSCNCFLEWQATRVQIDTLELAYR